MQMMSDYGPESSLFLNPHHQSDIETNKKNIPRIWGNDDFQNLKTLLTKVYKNEPSAERDQKIINHFKKEEFEEHFIKDKIKACEIAIIDSINRMKRRKIPFTEMEGFEKILKLGETKTLEIPVFSSPQDPTSKTGFQILASRPLAIAETQTDKLPGFQPTSKSSKEYWSLSENGIRIESPTNEDMFDSTVTTEEVNHPMAGRKIKMEFQK